MAAQEASEISSMAAPDIFEISQNSQLGHLDEGVAFEACPLCRSRRWPLICRNCVRTGDVADRPKLSIFKDRKTQLSYNSFKEAKDLLRSLHIERRPLREAVDNKSKEAVAHNAMQAKILVQEARVKELKELLSALQKEQRSKEKRLNAMKSPQNRSMITPAVVQQSQAKVLQKIEKAKANLDKLTKILKETEEKLIEMRRSKIKQITETILPVSRVDEADVDSHETSHTHSHSQQLEDEDMISSLEREVLDATSHQYIRGRWAQVDAPSSRQNLTIVNCRLQASGELPFLTQHCAQLLAAAVPLNDTQLIPREVKEEWAGLHHTSVLTHCIGNVLQIPLPYAPFIPVGLNLISLKQEELDNFLAQLNFNVVYLSCSQGVNMLTYEPKRTLWNINSLVNHPNFGRCKSFNIESTSLLQSMEENITNVFTNSTYQYGLTKYDDDETWSMVPETLPSNPEADNLYGSLATSALHTASELAGTTIASIYSSISSAWPFRGGGNE